MKPVSLSQLSRLVSVNLMTELPVGLWPSLWGFAAQSSSALSHFGTLCLCFVSAMLSLQIFASFTSQLKYYRSQTSPHISVSLSLPCHISCIAFFCYLNDSCICLQVYSILIIDSLSTGHSFILVTGLSLFPRTLSNRK